MRFSLFYSSEASIYEDKPNFRKRILKYLEDSMYCFSSDLYQSCRRELGIDIIRLPGNRIWIYKLEETFKEGDIKTILDLVTIFYNCMDDYWIQRKEPNKRLKQVTDFLATVNRILTEESMCYRINDKGEIRYFPDQEFNHVVNYTLKLIGKEKYSKYAFKLNESLSDLYQHYNSEQPIISIFRCLELLTLDLINNNKFKQLNDSLVDSLFNEVKKLIEQDSIYTPNDRKHIDCNLIQNNFKNLIKMCHKYRHSKPDQKNNDVPQEIFNYIYCKVITIW